MRSVMAHQFSQIPRAEIQRVYVVRSACNSDRSFHG